MSSSSREVEGLHAFQFNAIINFRDVGTTVNGYLGKKLMKEGVLFRSARPDDATLADRAKLRDELKLRTVLDLRTKTEHANQARKRGIHSAIPALVRSNAALAEPVQIPGLLYVQVRLTGRAFERFLVSQLSWWSFLKLVLLFLSGFRMQAIAVMGRDVMEPRGLVGLGIDTLDVSTTEMAEALATISAPASLPLLVHCTQGKDRTGSMQTFWSFSYPFGMTLEKKDKCLVVIVALMAIGVPLEAISHDYMLSEEELLPEKDQRLLEIREIGLSDEFADVAPDMVFRTEQHLRDKYGGVDGYLDRIGFAAQDRERLRQVLLY